MTPLSKRRAQILALVRLKGVAKAPKYRQVQSRQTQRVIREEEIHDEEPHEKNNKNVLLTI